MNNLLRTLTESNVKPSVDLRLLFTVVKEGRKQSIDTKLSDPFYDALEGLLLDLKSITLDNRDAEAFLKPVSKAEVPDYYDVIANPMDFQTMLKKVKQKQYKSKREFKDDLELIWSNCYTYNASENHPLRQCVKRLKSKADRLLKHITDRRDRTDPNIPPELSAGHTGIHLKINGTGRTHTRSPSYSSKPGTPGIASYRSFSQSRQSISRMNLPFPETPAITRTSEGMGMFYELDKEMRGALRKPNQRLIQKLKDLAPSPMMDDEKSEDIDMLTPKEEDTMEVDGMVGDKRRLQSPDDQRPRKRARFLTPYPVPLSSDNDEISELWWAAAQSDALLANGLPPIPFGLSSSSQKPPRSRDSTKLKTRSKKTKRRKKAMAMEVDETPPTHSDNPKALLNMMNTNIKTMRRVRHTHAKFAALNATTLANEETEEGAPATGAGTAGGAGPSSGYPTGTVGAGSAGPDGGNAVLNASADDEILNEKVDERPWSMLVQGKGKGKEVVRTGGIETGQKNAWDCLQWTNQKILEHVGFQGTSQVALDVLAGVMSEYLSNVGRTIKYLCDKYPTTMTPEEIVLHTLFESGTSKVQDLERYIRDDVERYGSRLNELEKKIVGAYRESTAGEVLEDEGLFEEEEEEETGALAIGEFADLLGEDYLGLRELGIAAEFGMSSLSIPKKLLKSKKNQLKPAAAKPSEPPPPFPPPSPFVPLISNKIDDQIGLLKQYYKGRFTTLAAAAASTPLLPMPSLSGPSIGLPGPSLPGPSLPGPALGVPSLPGPSIPAAQAPGTTPSLPSSNSITVPGVAPSASLPLLQHQSQSIDLASLPVITLPDDAPNPVQMKMGPLGQIVKGGGASAAAKKKAKGGASGSGSGTAGAGANPSSGATAVGGGAGVGVGAAAGVGVAGLDGASAKKKKGPTAIGMGNGRKKKGPEGSSTGTAPSGPPGSGQGSPPYPPVVVASA